MSKALRLHVVSQDGTVDAVHDIEGDTALIGRSRAAADRCDVVVERKDISRAHARVLRGVVVEDLASTNGTYVNGKRIQGATLVRTGSFQIGDPAGGNLVTVHVGEAEQAESDPDLGGADRTLAPGLLAVPAKPATAGTTVEVAGLRNQHAELVAEVARLRAELEGAREDARQAASAADELRHREAELDGDVARLESELQSALEAAHGAGRAADELRHKGAALGGDVARLGAELEQARQAADSAAREAEDLRQRHAALAADVARLGSELEAARTRAEAAGHEAEDLRHRHAVLGGDVARLEAELEAARASALAPTVEVEALRRQNAEHVEGLARTRTELDGARAGERAGAQALADLRQESLGLVRDLAHAQGELDTTRHALLDSQRDAATLRQQNADLLGELARVRTELEAARADTARESALAEAQQRIRQLEQRVASLKEEAAQREAERGSSPQLQLLADELAKVRTRAESLDRELTQARAQLESARQGEAGRAAGPEVPAPAAPKPSPMASAMIEQLTRRTRELEAELARARSGGATPAPAASDAAELRPVVEDLRRQLEESRRAAAALAAPAGDAAALVQLREENKRLSRDLFQCKAKLVTGGGGAAPRGGLPPDFLRKLLAEDLHTHSVGPLASPEEFLIAEAYVGFRSFERVVTRLATGFQQIFNENTILPGTEGSNFRMLAEGVFEAPHDEEARRALSSYMDDLSRWLAASVHAHRRAALRFFEALKSDLSEQGLTRHKPAGGLGFMVRAELWNRAQQHLSRQSASLIEERLDQLAREEANAIVSARPEADGGAG